MSQLKDLQRQIAAWWSARALRERLGLGLALLVLAGYFLAVPAWRTLKTVPAQIEALDRQTQEMQALAAEAGALRAMPPIAPEQARATLAAAASRLGERAALTMQADRALLTVRGMAGDQLVAWLTEVRLTARAKPVDSQLTRNAQGGYDGTVVFAFGGGRS